MESKRHLAPWTIVAALALAAGGLVAASPGAPSVAAGRAAGQVARGEEVFSTTCFACHGLDGKGALPGVPDFTDPGGRLAKTDEELFVSLRDGRQTPGAALAMPPRGGNPALTDDDLVAVLGYLRATFGTGPAATPGTVDIVVGATPAPPPADEPVTAVAALPSPAASAVDIGRGVRLWANTCNRCHNLRDPGEFTDVEWSVIVMHMRLRAGLTGGDTRDILGFLKASN